MNDKNRIIILTERQLLKDGSDSYRNGYKLEDNPYDVDKKKNYHDLWSEGYWMEEKYWKGQ